VGGGGSNSKQPWGFFDSIHHNSFLPRPKEILLMVSTIQLRRAIEWLEFLEEVELLADFVNHKRPDAGQRRELMQTLTGCDHRRRQGRAVHQRGTDCEVAAA